MLPVLCIWLAWIIWRRATWAEAKRRYASIPRSRRILMSVLASVAGPAILLAGLVLIDLAGGFKGSLSIPTLGSVAVLGFGFIELQMAAVAISGSLVADSVTAPNRASSKMKEQEEDNR
jgi:hypothetical protein